MKISTPALAIIVGWATVAWAAAPGTLTSLRAVHFLSNAEASQALPVAFEATVTYYDRNGANKDGVDLFVQDGDLAIYVHAAPGANWIPGDRVLVRGKTHLDFRPDIVSSEMTLLHHGEIPKPVAASFQPLIRAELDCMRVTVRAKVRSADMVVDGGVLSIYLELLMEGGYINATVIGNDESMLKDMLDADVEITGTAAGMFDGKNQLTGVLLEVPTLADVKILKHAQTDPASLAVTPMDEILKKYFVHDQTERVRVQGTITYYQPGSAVVLQNGTKSLWVMTQSEKPLHVGHVADVTGFPDVRDGNLTLTRGEIAESQVQAPVTPLRLSWPELASGNNTSDLVSVEGKVLTAVRGAAQDEYVLASDGHLFSAIYRHPDEGSGIPVPPMKQIPAGSQVRVAGICMLDYGSDPFGSPVAFDLLMRSFNDIAVVANPSPINTRSLISLVALLLAVLFLVGARGWVIDRRMRNQTATLAYIERRRSRILEDINGSRSLAEIIDQITELVSMKLNGAPCWCEIADGPRQGNYPPKLASFRIAHEQIPPRSGPPLGTVYAAFDPLTKPSANEPEALYVAAALATLAIETRRLHADLLHRSEFDLLTETHNRFSLERHMDSLVEEARQSGGIVGLIYIDLDRFKQINDLHGHQIGDRYLQEVVHRMKQQLRAHDRLARIGGDEFVALVPVVRGRADVEEIAQRLEHCFDEPFVLEAIVLNGSASIGIALYPEDGESRDDLLNFADTAMYSAKNRKRQIETALSVMQDSETLPNNLA
jgi:diguanylate cyclase (GGDEF)-like protein